jgi:predicted nucleic acid-binding Zn finger protein
VNLSSSVWMERWIVIGSTGKPYTVAKNREGEFGCTCMDWINKRNKGKRQDCKHILAKKLELLTEISAKNATIPIGNKNSKFDDIIEQKRGINLK